MANIDALIATNLWWEERKQNGAHHFILRTIPMLFQTLDALYIETRKLPLHSQSGRTMTTVSEAYTITYGIFLKPVDYATLRSVLSLSGDVYEMLAPLNNLTEEELLELEVPVKSLCNYSERFKDIRNFYTHLGEALTNMVRHGITGPVVTESGITYSPTARYCIHLVWDNSMVYFTYKNKERTIIIDKPAYDPVFRTAKEIYQQITSHEINKNNRHYTRVEELYPEVHD
jgi:hypothetical protein